MAQRIFGLVVSLGGYDVTPDIITFCQQNGWEVELSIVSTSAFMDTGGGVTNAQYIASEINALCNAGIPVWLEIENLTFYAGGYIGLPGSGSSITTAAGMEVFTPGLKIYEAITNPLFRGYCFEGSFDFCIKWLKSHTSKKICWHALPGYYQAYSNSSGTPITDPLYGADSSLWVVNGKAVGQEEWRVNQFDEISWEVYQQDAIGAGVSYWTWLQTKRPGLPFGVLTGFCPIDPSSTSDPTYACQWWLNLATHNAPIGTAWTTAQQESILASILPTLKKTTGPFSNIIADSCGQALTYIQPVCNYLNSLKLTGGGNTTTINPSTSGTISVAVSAASVASTLTISGPTTAVTGTAFTVTGKLTRNDTSAGVAGQTISLLRNGTASTTATTASDGTYSMSITETAVGTDTYQVSFAGASV
jgi:hypothetical protein